MGQICEDERYATLKLENQLCFPLYACSKEVIRRYKPFLDEIDLTYTQYITMMVLWDKRTAAVNELGECLMLDSGTLTPLLKKLEAKGLVQRVRDESDARRLMVSLTNEGLALRDRALAVPEGLGRCVAMDPQEAAELYRLLHKMLDLLRD